MLRDYVLTMMKIEGEALPEGQDNQEIGVPLQADIARAMDQLADRIQTMGADPNVAEVLCVLNNLSLQCIEL